MAPWTLSPLVWTLHSLHSKWQTAQRGKGLNFKIKCAPEWSQHTLNAPLGGGGILSHAEASFIFAAPIGALSPLQPRPAWTLLLLHLLLFYTLKHKDAPRSAHSHIYRLPSALLLLSPARFIFANCEFTPSSRHACTFLWLSGLWYMFFFFFFFLNRAAFLRSRLHSSRCWQICDDRRVFVLFSSRL